MGQRRGLEFWLWNKRERQTRNKGWSYGYYCASSRWEPKLGSKDVCVITTINGVNSQWFECYMVGIGNLSNLFFFRWREIIKLRIHGHSKSNMVISHWRVQRNMIRQLISFLDLWFVQVRFFWFVIWEEIS